MNPYREAADMPELKDRRSHLLPIATLLLGLFVGATADHFTKPVREVEAPACKDMHVSWTMHGEHECPHPKHQMSDVGWGNSAMCRCAR